MVINLKQGLALRKSNWTHCVCEVQDVGSYSFWGILKDIKNGFIINPCAVYPLSNDWEIALDAQDLINSL